MSEDRKQKRRQQDKVRRQTDSEWAEKTRNYNRAYYHRHHDRMRVKRNKFVQKHKMRVQEAKLGLGGQCVMCGFLDWDCLVFDHIDPETKAKDRNGKRKNVCQFIGASDEDFWNEVAKCQLLCCNCHAKRTLLQLKNK